MHCYRPLPEDSIRLVRILPRGSDGTVRCETFEVSLLAGEEYYALSYTWGNPPANSIIELNGKQVLVRKNIWRFLVQMSSLEHTWLNPIWIDSLSINQDYTKEKTQQIGLMERIFKQARSVIVWLGPAYNDSDRAMRAVSAGTTISKIKKQARFWSRDAGLALTRLCNRSYWTRLWILQEIVLSKKIILICGQMSVDWASFERKLASIDTEVPAEIESSVDAGNNIMDSFSNVTTPIDGGPQRMGKRDGDIQAVLNSPAMAIVRWKRLQSAQEVSLWNFMVATQGLDCAQPQDRVFALLGIAIIHSSSAITADYGRPLRCLLNEVIRDHYSTHRPESVEAVAKECVQLAHMFGVEPRILFELGTEERVVPLPQIKQKSQCPLGNSDHRLITLWWTLCYGHVRIGELIMGDRTVRAEDLINETWDWAVMTDEGSVIETLISLCEISAEMYTTALSIASRNGYERITRILIEAGADVNAQEMKYGTALQAASLTLDNGVVKILLSAGADPNGQGGSFGNALQAAAQCGNIQAMELLLAAGADPNAQGGEYYTALLGAVYNSRTESVAILLAAGADLNAQGGNIDTQGRKFGTPLHLASHKAEIHIVQMLITAGANVHAQGGRFDHVTWAAANRENKLDRPAVIHHLLEKGASFHSGYRDKLGRSFIHISAAHGYPESIQLAVDQGLSLDERDNGGWTPLHWATWTMRAPTVRFLLDSGAKHDLKDWQGQTAEQMAAYAGLRRVGKIICDVTGRIQTSGSLQFPLSLGICSSCMNQYHCTECGPRDGYDLCLRCIHDADVLHPHRTFTSTFRYPYGWR